MLPVTASCGSPSPGRRVGAPVCCHARNRRAGDPTFPRESSGQPPSPAVYGSEEAAGSAGGVSLSLGLTVQGLSGIWSSASWPASPNRSGYGLAKEFEAGLRGPGCEERDQESLSADPGRFSTGIWLSNCGHKE